MKSFPAEAIVLSPAPMVETGITLGTSAVYMPSSDAKTAPSAPRVIKTFELILLSAFALSK